MGRAKGGDELGETMRILAGPEKRKKRRMDVRSGFFIIPTLLVSVRNAQSTSHFCSFVLIITLRVMIKVLLTLPKELRNITLLGISRVHSLV